MTSLLSHRHGVLLYDCQDRYGSTAPTIQPYKCGLTFNDSICNISRLYPLKFICMRRFTLPILRLSYSGKIPPTSVRFWANSKAFTHNCSTQAPCSTVASANMGKEKVQFQLKTAKGTKDCRNWTAYYTERCEEANWSKGMARTWSSVTGYSRPLPRSSNAMEQ